MDDKRARARDFRRKQHLKQRHSRWRPPRTGPAAAADAISSGDEDDHQGDEHAAAGGFSRRKMASNTWRFEHDDDDETIERQYDRNMRELGLMSNQAPNEEPLLLKSDHPLDVLLPGERPEPDGFGNLLDVDLTRAASLLATLPPQLAFRLPENDIAIEALSGPAAPPTPAPLVRAPVSTPTVAPPTTKLSRDQDAELDALLDGPAPPAAPSAPPAAINVPPPTAKEATIQDLESMLDDILG